MDNKEMDKIFQDHLGDYREQPDPQVWDRIRSDLDSRKKKSRVIPLWWRWGAAAAVLLIALFLTVPWDSRDPEIPGVTSTGSETNQSPAIRTTEKTQGAEPVSTQVPPVEVVDVQAPDSKGSRVTPVQEEAGSSVGVSSGNTSENRVGKVAAITNDPRDIRSDSADDKDLPQVAATDSGAPASLVENQPSTRADNPTAENTAVAAGQEEIRNPVDQPADGKKSIFEEIEAAEAIAEEKDASGKWSLGPMVAPVYFNSFGEGSPIASNFVNNSKSGSVNMSYGLQVSYKVSRKLRIRSGVHRVDYGYNTEDVGFTSSPTARPSSLIRTISYSEESKSLVVQSMVDNPGAMQPGAVDVSAPSPARQGQMVQEFGYLEVPLEMQFSLIDKKFGVDLIGGMSSLFLIDNSVSLESSGAVTEVGEATNMNSLNFSTNFGLGFFYRLNQSFELNLQPMFKYQLNTFTQTSGNFNPYSVGIYSGLSFRF